MKFSDYIKDIYNEIVDPDDWAYTYKHHHPKSASYFGKAIPRLKQVFITLNNGKFDDMIIYDYDSTLDVKNNRIGVQDQKVIDFLKGVGYTVTQDMYKLGICVKNGKEIPIATVLKEWKNRSSNKEKMKAAYEQTKNEKIKEQIEVIEKFEKEAIDKILVSKGHLNEKKIVFSMDPRTIASQSTDVGWRSCMNLNDGEYNEFVKTGIEAGQFIAFLAEVGDEQSLKSPKGRVLIKPFKNNKGEWVYITDMFYPRDMTDKYKTFRDQVQKILDEKINSQASSGVYKIHGEQYQDELGEEHEHVGRDIAEMIASGNYANFGKLTPAKKEIVIKKDKDLISRIYKSGGNISNRNILESLKRFPDQIIKHEDLLPVKLRNEARYVAIDYKPELILKISNPSDGLKEAAVLQDADLIFKIPGKTDIMMKQAIALKPQLVIKLIQQGHIKENNKNPFIEKAIVAWPDVVEDIVKAKIDIPEKLWRKAVDQDPEVIIYHPKPPTALQIQAIKIKHERRWNFFKLDQIKNLSEAAAIEAIKIDLKDISELPENFVNPKHRKIADIAMDNERFETEAIWDDDIIKTVVKMVPKKEFLKRFPSLPFYLEWHTYSAGRDPFTIADKMYAVSQKPEELLASLDDWHWAPTDNFIKFIKRHYPKIYKDHVAHMYPEHEK